MTDFVIPIAVVVRADRISDVDDDAFVDALIAFPDVVQVSSRGPITTIPEPSSVHAHEDVWARIKDATR